MRAENVYLDNAATTLPKPACVAEAVTRAVTRFAANPGRGGHAFSRAGSDALFEARQTAADFFGAKNPENVVFTPGCTYSLNFAIKGLLRPGDHVIISDTEHNAVVRPLHSLEKLGVTVSRAHVFENDPDATLASFSRCVRKNTALVCCLHASNVSGIRLPVREIGGLCRRIGVPFIIDGAQSAGLLPLTPGACNADIICVPAHKGLYGAAGTGAMILSGSAIPETVIEGGTGNASSLRTMPDDAPERFESGTVNLCGILAMQAGIGFVTRRGRENIARHEYRLMCAAYDELRKISGVVLYTSRPEPEGHVPLIPLNIGDLSSEECGRLFSDMGIAVRAGYHCAYDAHLSLGTKGRGAVRICPSAFTTEAQIDYFSDCAAQIAKKY